MITELSYNQAVQYINYLKKLNKPIEEKLKRMKQLMTDDDYFNLLYDLSDEINVHEFEEFNNDFYDDFNFVIEAFTVDKKILEKVNWNVKISIRDRERCGYPHMHISNENDNFYCGVCLNDHKYFIHDKYVNKLNSNERKLLVKILKLPYKNNKNKNIWQAMCESWNLSPYTNEISTNMIDFPDYINMKESCH